MRGQVDLINQALDLIRAQPVTSYDENSETGRRVRSHFVPARQYMLQSNAWSFCEARQSLSQTADAPEDPNWTYRFQLPPRFLKFRSLQAIDTGMSVHLTEEMGAQYMQRGQYVYCDWDVIYAIYTEDVDTTGLWPAAFDDAFAYHLAWRMAPSFKVPGVDRNTLKADAGDMFVFAVSQDRGLPRNMRLEPSHYERQHIGLGPGVYRRINLMPSGSGSVS